MRFFHILIFLNALLIGSVYCATARTESVHSSPHSSPKRAFASTSSQPYTAQDHAQALRSERKGLEKQTRKYSDRTVLAGCSQAFCLFGNGGHWRHHSGKADGHNEKLQAHKNQLETTLARKDFEPAKDPKGQKSLNHEVKWAKKRLDQYPKQEAHRIAVRNDHIKQERINRGDIPQSHYDNDSEGELFG